MLPPANVFAELEVILMVPGPETVMLDPEKLQAVEPEVTVSIEPPLKTRDRVLVPNDTIPFG